MKLSLARMVEIIYELERLGYDPNKFLGRYRFTNEFAYLQPTKLWYS